jgi:DNA-binding CsgD family transcriptional regulator
MRFALVPVAVGPRKPHVVTTEELQARQHALRQAEATTAEAALRLKEAIREAKESQSLAEIARSLGVSRQRVWQLLK